MAKQHLEEEFLVVGIQDMYDQSLKVMQALLPSYLPSKDDIFIRNVIFMHVKGFDYELIPALQTYKR